jgi:hypothetical protein
MGLSNWNHLKSQQNQAGPESKVVHGPPKTLGLLQAVSSGSRAASLVIMRDNESPWDTFQPVFDCRLAGRVIIAVQKSRPHRIKAIREFPPEHAGKILQFFYTVQHKNILSTNECYRDKGRVFALVKDCPLTLEHLVSLKLDQHILGAIIFQVRRGRCIYVTSY